MFRLQNHVPSNYIDGSRDFQLFCRLYDCVNSGVKNDIDSIIEILDPLKIKDNLLSLYETKIGFFTKINYNDHVLRTIFSAFPYIMKYKGTKYGIELAVSTILKTEGIHDPPEIEFDNDTHSVNIYTSTSVYNKDALIELLKYILPVGYTYSIGKFTSVQVPTQLAQLNKVKTLNISQISTSQVRGTDRILDTSTSANEFDFDSELENKYIGTINSTTIVGSNEAELDTQTYDTDRNGTLRDTIDKADNITENEYPEENN